MLVRRSAVSLIAVLLVVVSSWASACNAACSVHEADQSWHEDHRQFVDRGSAGSQHCHYGQGSTATPGSGLQNRGTHATMHHLSLTAFETEQRQSTPRFFQLAGLDLSISNAVAGCIVEASV